VGGVGCGVCGCCGVVTPEEVVVVVVVVVGEVGGGGWRFGGMLRLTLTCDWVA
jgi:hypothetical protein